MSNTFLTGVRDLNLKHSSGWVNNLGTITVSRHITNIGIISQDSKCPSSKTSNLLTYNIYHQECIF
ncbi:MAG: hypothetical protein M9888_00825 [Chitinophagales bacterium]|nr:hypothetical protein [Chitinophagales bacterium]